MSTQSELLQSQECIDRQELNAFMWKFLKQTNKYYMEQSIMHNIGKDIVSKSSMIAVDTDI